MPEGGTAAGADPPVHAAIGSAAGLVAGRGNHVEAGLPASVEMFGLVGTGSRLVFVFDRSASMEGYGGRPLQAAKAALLAALDDLNSVHQFQIVFYNDAIAMLEPATGGIEGMMFGTDVAKRASVKFVRSIGGVGGTDHMRALRHALSLGPDVVFFLTDAEGGFTPQELGEIQRLNRTAASINAIEFGAPGRAPNRSLESLARQNRGHYVFQDISVLGQ
jgi:hypothetical protein